jgi:hypothetical protein
MTLDGDDAELILAESPDSHEAFPRLTADQLDVLKTWGVQRAAEVRDFLYRAADRHTRAGQWIALEVKLSAPIDATNSRLP